MDDLQKTQQALHDNINSESGQQVVKDYKKLPIDLAPSCSDSAVTCHQATLSDTCERVE